MLNYKFATKFKAVAYTKMKALMGKYIWDKVRLTKKAYRFPIIWVFTYKENWDSYIMRFKACLVVYKDL